MAAAVVYAFISPLGLPITISQHTRNAYNEIEALPKGAFLVFGMDYSPASIPELEPTMKTMFYQAMKKDLRVIMIGMWVMAGDMGERILTEMEPLFPNKKYGVDYINIGYKAGGAVLLEKAVDDIVAASVGIDHRGNSLPGNLPILQDFKSLKDAAFWVCAPSGTPGVPDWIKVVGDPLKIPGTTAIVSVSVPETMPFVQSGQLKGIVAGMRGAAEYELLGGRPGRAVAGMDAQSLTHVVILAFIVLGNLAYVTRKKV
jgi:hypothetical protein